VVNFVVNGDMILRGNEGDEPTAVNAHTEKKIKRKGMRGATVAIVTAPESRRYRISFFNRQRLDDNTSVPFGYK